MPGGRAERPVNPLPFILLSGALMLGSIAAMTALSIESSDQPVPAGECPGERSLGWPLPFLVTAAYDTEGAEPSREWSPLALVVDAAVLLLALAATSVPGAWALYSRARHMLEDLS